MVGNGRSRFAVIDRGLRALAQVQFAGTDFQPVIGALVEVETPAQCDDPAVVEFDAAVMERGAGLDVELDAVFLQAPGDGDDLGTGFLFFLIVLVVGDKLDFLHGASIDTDFTEVEEVGDLMVMYGSSNLTFFAPCR